MRWVRHVVVASVKIYRSNNSRFSMKIVRFFVFTITYSSSLLLLGPKILFDTGFFEHFQLFKTYISINRPSRYNRCALIRSDHAVDGHISTRQSNRTLMDVRRKGPQSSGRTCVAYNKQKRFKDFIPIIAQTMHSRLSSTGRGRIERIK